MAEVVDDDDDDPVNVESECNLAPSVVSKEAGDSVGGAGVRRSSSPRDTTEEAKLDTLPVELRFERERSENAAAEEAVDVREDVGGFEELA